jgi:hypothetical protein
VNRFVQKCVCAVVACGAMSVAVPAAAQDLSLGYQFQRFSGEGDAVNAPVGFNVDVAAPLAGSLSLVGQFDWSRKSASETVFGTSVDATANFATFGGGLRWNAGSNGSAAPFVQALVGATRSSFDSNVAGQQFDAGSGTDAMFQIGAGVTVPMSGTLSALGQVDYRRIFGEGEGVNSVRFVAGIRVGL